MKQLLLSVLALCSIEVYGQSNDSTRRSVMIGVRVQGGFTYRDLSTISSDPAVTGMIKFRDMNENPIASCGFGLDLMRPVANRVLGSVGVNYSILGFGSVFELNPPVDSILRFKLYDRFHYLEFPVKSVFIISKRFMDLNLGGGISPAILATAKHVSKRVYDGGETKTQKSLINGYRPFNIFLSANAGIGRKIGSRGYLRCDLEYKYGILTIINAPIKGNLFCYGINLGYYYAL